MKNEGYIKFKSVLLRSAPPAEWELEEINIWRDRLYALGYIGAYSSGIGYGNISIKTKYLNEFIITGSATGNFPILFPEHYTRVKSYSLAANNVVCEGTIHASSESMTHAAVYGCDPKVGAVIHIHSRNNWQRLLNIIPTTDTAAQYGTPEMAEEIHRLYNESDFSKLKVMVMGGHEEGILSCGINLDDAGTRLLKILI